MQFVNHEDIHLFCTTLTFIFCEIHISRFQTQSFVGCSNPGGEEIETENPYGVTV